MPADRPDSPPRPAPLWAVRCRHVAAEGLWRNNPLAVQALGICAAMAVTTRVETALVLGAAVVCVLVPAAVCTSMLRRAIPPRVRLIAQITIIATFVVLFNESLAAYYPQMSRRLGPYVALIITNCIIMGRTEAFALRNPPHLAALDAVAHGTGYALVLVAVGFVRELLGSGRVLRLPILSTEWYPPNLLLVTAPGAFFVLAALVAASNAIRRRPDREDRP